MTEPPHRSGQDHDGLLHRPGVAELEAAFSEVSLSAPDLDNPEWEKAGRVHDWRNYVPDAVKGCWAWLDTTARIAVYLTADGMASSEDWD